MSWTRSTLITVALLLPVVALPGQGAGRGTGGAPPAAAGWVGTLECLQCTLHLDPAGTWVEFGTEPVVQANSGSLLRGDVLVAVDNLLITTQAGGRRLANLDGRPTRFTIRRAGKEIVAVFLQGVQWSWGQNSWRYETVVVHPSGRPSDSTIVTRAINGVDTTYMIPPRPITARDSGTVHPRTTTNTYDVDRSPVGAGSRTIADTSIHEGHGAGRGVGVGIDTSGHVTHNEMNVTTTRGWLGIALDCLRCSVDREDHTTHDGTVRFTTPPRIVAIEPGAASNAGFKVGDIIRSIDGDPMTSAAGAERFSTLRALQRVRFVVERQGRPVSITLVVPPKPE